MAPAPSEPMLLDALDHRQDDVLRQLEALNERVEQLVARCQKQPFDRPA